MKGKVLLLLTTMTAALVMASGVALAATISCKLGATYCFGTNADDLIYGTSGDDEIYPYGGDDVVRAYTGNDKVIESYGGNDVVYADYGRDEVQGEEGNDRLYGENGDDNLYGGPGSDAIFADYPKPNYGNDRIWALDGSRDYIYCGPGIDIVQSSDRIDWIMDCEHVRRRY